jgi:4-amino-4-deoxy-L-arabinose transferase-like glycosyltransferase
MLDSETVETVSSVPDTPINNTPAARIGWAILILATLYICYFSHLGAMGFVGPDEPRYAWIARDMAETGDWVTPRLYGKPWFEKPPLYYWGAALSFKLFGVSEAAARLPSAISALLATLALAWLTLRLCGAETARWLLLLLPTTVGMIGFSHAAATDMPFSAMLTIAMVCAAVVLGLTQNENSSIIPQTRWLALILFGFFLGLAVLAKGPAGIILTGGAIFFWALFTKRWRDTFRLLHPATLATFFVTALPWYILCARRNPDFFRIFIIEHNFKRYLTPEFQHIQPFWFYIPITLIAVLPWTVIVLAQLVSVISSPRSAGPAVSAFLFSASAFPIVFFSLSQSKLPGYVLPALFPLLLLLCRFTSIRVRESSLLLGRLLSLLGTLVLVGGVLASRRTWQEPRAFPFDQAWLWYWIAAIFVVGSFIALAGTMGWLRPALVSIVVAVLCLVEGTNRFILPQVDSDLTAHPLGIYASTLPASVVNQLCIFELERSAEYSLKFYYHRDLPAWSDEQKVCHEVFLSRKGMDDLERQGIPIGRGIRIFKDVWHVSLGGPK